MRGSTQLGEAKMPYDLLYILNQFFQEVNKALESTKDHYAQFAGDGLMALYGLNASNPASGAADALRGAREMLARIDQLNMRLKGDLLRPLRIGIGSFRRGHCRDDGPAGVADRLRHWRDGEHVRASGEPDQEYDCRVIVSRRAADNGRPRCQSPHNASGVGKRRSAR